MSEISAAHEAGHAFIATFLGTRVRSVTIDPDWDDGPERHGDVQIEWRLGEFTDQELCEKRFQGTSSSGKPVRDAFGKLCPDSTASVDIVFFT